MAKDATLFEDEAPIEQLGKRRAFSEEFLQKLETAVSDRSSPEGQKLQKYLDHRAERTRALIDDILESERLTAEDLAVRVDVIE